MEVDVVATEIEVVRVVELAVMHGRPDVAATRHPQGAHRLLAEHVASRAVLVANEYSLLPSLRKYQLGLPPSNSQCENVSPSLSSFPSDPSLDAENGRGRTRCRGYR